MDKLRGIKSHIITKASPSSTGEVKNTSLIQLIDGNGKFNVNDLNDFSKMVELSNSGLSYAVVSIIGPQSSGKSTLVNHLFGTSFKEMEAIKGRSQTTKGIWLSRAADIEPFTVVLDVEGSDGMERGEDGDLFEKQSALFALAVSDVVLVNMWCHEVGREKGGSRPLLKIVIEKILSLGSPRKITLLFILRDDDAMTPLAYLKETLRTSVQEIYDSVPKHEDYATAPLSLYFEVQVISLPHFRLQPEKFKEQVEALKTKFVFSTVAGGLIGVQEDKVPSSAIAFSLPKIWKTIKENKDLDLPKHKVMVATVRCDEIIKESLLKFAADQDWRRLERSLKSGPVSEFGKTINLIINKYLTEFDGKVVHFEEGVRIFKRQNLLDKILQHVQRANESMLEHLYAKALTAYKEKFSKADHASDHYLAAVQDCTAYSLSIFEKGTKEMENGYISWDTSKVFDRLQHDINMYTTLAQLQASLAEAKAAREEAFAIAATARAEAAKASEDARVAAEILAEAKKDVAKALAESKAAAAAQAIAANEVAQQAAADKKAAAAERASAEVQANAAKASAAQAAADVRAAAAERTSAAIQANELKAAAAQQAADDKKAASAWRASAEIQAKALKASAEQAAADVKAAAAERASAEIQVNKLMAAAAAQADADIKAAAAERTSAAIQANELKAAAAQQAAEDKKAAAAWRASAEIQANALKASAEQAAADVKAAAAERASVEIQVNKLMAAAAAQADADIKAAAAERASAEDQVNAAKAFAEQAAADVRAAAAERAYAAAQANEITAAAQQAAADIRAANIARASAAAQEDAERAKEEETRRNRSLMEWINYMIIKGFGSVLKFLGISE